MFKRKLMKGVSDSKRSELEKHIHGLDEQIKQEQNKNSNLELRMKFLQKQFMD